MDFNSGTGALGKGADEVAADVPGTPDIHLEGNGLLRFANRIEHRRENLVAIQQLHDVIAFDQRRTQKVAHGTGKFRIAGRVLSMDRLADTLFRKERGTP